MALQVVDVDGDEIKNVVAKLVDFLEKEKIDEMVGYAAMVYLVDAIENVRGFRHEKHEIPEGVQ